MRMKRAEYHRLKKHGPSVDAELCHHCHVQEYKCKQKTRSGNQCSSEQEALARAAVIEAESLGQVRLAPYRCHWCELWHLTSRPYKQRQPPAPKRKALRKQMFAEELKRRAQAAALEGVVTNG